MHNEIKLWLQELESTANDRRDDFRRKHQGQGKQKHYIWKSKTKNEEIKVKLSTEGEKLSTDKITYSARSSTRAGKSRAREWLYDFSLRTFDEDKSFLGVPLVAEIELSEWKYNGLKYDFNKLLQSDADNKLFVFQQKDSEQASESINKLKQATTAYKHKSNSHLIIACWLTGEYKFKFVDIPLKNVP